MKLRQELFKLFFLAYLRLCKDCRFNFTIGDARVKTHLIAKKALAVIVYSLGKSSYRMLARLFGVSASLVYRWIREAADQLPMPQVPGNTSEIEFDQM